MIEQASSISSTGRFIPLVDPIENLHTIQGGWSTQEKLIPAIGLVVLKVLSDTGEQEEDNALAIINRRLVKTKAKELYNTNFYPLQVEFFAITPKKNGLMCSIALPIPNVILNSEFFFEDDEFSKDPRLRNYAFTQKWKVRGDSEEFHFFAPRDINFLSSLRFSFRSVSNVYTPGVK